MKKNQLYKYSFCRLGSNLSVKGDVEGGTKLSVLDALTIGSSLSMRSWSRMGSATSVMDFLQLGSTVSVCLFNL